MMLDEALKKSAVYERIGICRMAERKVVQGFKKLTFVVTDKTYPNGVCIISNLIGSGTVKEVNTEEIGEHDDWKPINKIEGG